MFRQLNLRVACRDLKNLLKLCFLFKEYASLDSDWECLNSARKFCLKKEEMRYILISFSNNTPLVYRFQNNKQAIKLISTPTFLIMYKVSRKSVCACGLALPNRLSYSDSSAYNIRIRVYQATPGLGLIYTKKKQIRSDIYMYTLTENRIL